MNAASSPTSTSPRPAEGQVARALHPSVNSSRRRMMAQVKRQHQPTRKATPAPHLGGCTFQPHWMNRRQPTSSIQLTLPLSKLAQVIRHRRCTFAQLSTACHQGNSTTPVPRLPGLPAVKSVGRRKAQPRMEQCKSTTSKPAPTRRARWQLRPRPIRPSFNTEKVSFRKKIHTYIHTYIHT